MLLERLYVGLVLKEFSLTSNSLIDNLSALEIPGECGGKRIQGWCVVSFRACNQCFRCSLLLCFTLVRCLELKGTAFTGFL